MNSNQYKELEKFYLEAPINKEFYPSKTALIDSDYCEISLKLKESYFHRFGALHGSVYFNLLDDSAFFAVNSNSDGPIWVTTNLNVTLTRPVNQGKILAKGKVRSKSSNLIVAESTLYNELGKEIGFATGNFMKSKATFSSYFK